jgi:transposase
MALQSPYRVVLTDAERAVLSARAHAERAAHRDVVRARIVLAAADEEPNAQIARRLSLCQDTVRKWRARFCREGLPGLADRPRPGRRRTFPKTAEAEVKALACELPAESEVPLARWSHAELAAEAVTRGVVEAISPSTVGRWLRADAIRPWRFRSWIFPRDPDFQSKAGRVLDLYQRRLEGRLLHPGDFVICADEKSQLQALARRHQTLAAAPRRPALVEFEYKRGGTLAYLAAWDVHHARIFGRCEPKTGIEPFGRLVEHVMTSEPYASAKTVFWIVDNGSSHAGKTSIARMRDAYPNARLIQLPVHASWLNQIELFFSILQRKALTPNDFVDLDALAARIQAFEDHYRQIAKPFDWTFTRTKLDALLAKLAAREPHLRLAA